MRTVHIKFPIWKTRSVGINENKITDDLKIIVDYTNVHGEKIYPYPFLITKDRALNYPVQMVRGAKLHIIPLSAMEELCPKKEDEKPSCENNMVEQVSSQATLI